MKHLLYAIRRAATAAPSPSPFGVDGTPVQLLDEAGLTAVYSVLDLPVKAAIPDLIAYSQVIDELARTGDVLPMRYGSAMDSENEIRGLLRQRRERYLASLDEVAGCVEMGLRVLAPEADIPRISFAPPANLDDRTAGRPEAGEANSLFAASSSSSAGLNYLARRKAYFADRDSRRTRTGKIAADLRAVFANLSAKCLEECPMGQEAPLLSLFFLLRREKIEAFRELFRQFQKTSPDRILLTGPWPPYSFVASQPSGLVALA